MRYSLGVSIGRNYLIGGIVSKPHGDSASYEVGMEQNGSFLRIQVKSTTYRRKVRIVYVQYHGLEAEMLSAGVSGFYRGLHHAD